MNKKFFQNLHSQSGVTLVEAMISVSILSSIVWIYSDSVKNTLSAHSKAETSSLYTIGSSILENEISKQTSSFIFGPMTCADLGDSTKAGDITSVPEFMAVNDIRDADNPLTVSGMILSRDQTKFNTLKKQDGSTLQLTSIPKASYQNAYTACKNKLTRTVNVGSSNQEFQFCVYLDPVSNQKNLAPYVPFFAIVNVKFIDFQSNDPISCSSFRASATSDSTSVRESVGAAVNYSLYWLSYNGSTVGSYTNTFLTSSPKSHIMFKTYERYSGDDIGGLSGADRICQKAGATAGLYLRFRAVMSDSKTNAIDRLRLFGRISSIDGTIIANSPADFWKGISPNAGYELLTNYGDDEYVGGTGIDDYAWTGTGTTGLRYDDTGLANKYCNDWTSNTGNTIRGHLLSSATASGNPRMHSSTMAACFVSYSMLCISE